MYKIGKAKYKFNLTVSVIKEGRQYIAYSPALDLSTCGKNEKEARKNFVNCRYLL